MIEQLWDFIQIGCAGVMTIGGAGAIFVALYRWAKKPDINRDEKLNRHDEMLANDKRRIDEHEKRLDESEEADTVLMRAILALMNHAIDGDHIEELVTAKEDLHDFLFNRRVKK